MIHVLRSYVVGPLEPFAEGFAAELARQGYTVDTRRQQLGLVAHLSRWMAAGGLDVAELAPQVVERYVDARRAADYRQFRSVKALAPLLGYLRGLAVLTDTAPQSANTTSAVLLQRFRAYLLDERALGAASARGYVDLVAAFVEECVRDGGDLRGLTAAEVTSFLVGESRRLSPKTLQRSATALRALLRFWHVQGLTATSLVEAVPKVAYRSAGLPRGLRPGQVEAMLGSCDRRRSGRVARLRDADLCWRGSGCARGEVAGLGLDDIDWRSGELAVAGKGRRLIGCRCWVMPGGDRRLSAARAAGRMRWIAGCSSGSAPRTAGSARVG